MICIGLQDGINIRTMKERLRQLLAQRQKQHIIDASRAPAAVLVPIYCREGQYYILFTLRTDRVSTHKGQISFPGGACDEGDRTPADTALRECAEEIGLARQHAEILGELDDVCSLTSNYVISPFVALIPYPYQFKLNEEETNKIIEVPISALLKNGCRHGTEIIDGKAVTSYFCHYEGNVIWGATARILNQFLSIFAQLGDANCMTY